MKTSLLSPKDNYRRILTEIAKYIDFLHTNLELFDCTEPSPTTALQGNQSSKLGELGEFRHLHYQQYLCSLQLLFSVAEEPNYVFKYSFIPHYISFIIRPSHVTYYTLHISHTLHLPTSHIIALTSHILHPSSYHTSTHYTPHPPHTHTHTHTHTVPHSPGGYVLVEL